MNHPKSRRGFLSFLFPSSCSACGGWTKDSSLCEACRRKYAEETFLRCPTCGKRADRCLCGTEWWTSSATPLAGRRFLALTWYVPRARGEEARLTDRMLLSMKQKETFADFFAAELARELSRLFSEAGENAADWILTWCPRSAGKLMGTGYDQGEEVARRAAALLGTACVGLFVRSSLSMEQKTLGGAERVRNAEESLILRSSATKPGMKVILFDDIITSGATMRKAAEMLAGAGAGAVFPAAIARTQA